MISGPIPPGSPSVIARIGFLCIWSGSNTQRVCHVEERVGQAKAASFGDDRHAVPLAADQEAARDARAYFADQSHALDAQSFADSPARRTTHQHDGSRPI